jgi:hypothetical protein
MTGSFGLLLLLVVGATADEPRPAPLELSRDTVVLGLFQGSRIVRATTEARPGARVVFRLIGPTASLRTRRLRRLGVLWVKGEVRRFRSVPSVLRIHGWPERPRREDLERHRLDWRPLSRRRGAEGPARRELVAMKRASGLYGIGPSVASAEPSAELRLPADAPPGTYVVTVHVLEGETVVAAGERQLVVRRSDAMNAVRDLAQHHPALYALAAVLLALGVGLLAGRLVGLLARKGASPARTESAGT